MPVSDIRWSLSHQLPVFAVYGTKRKVDWLTEQDQSTDSQNLAPAKKLCPDVDVPGNGMNDMVNHNKISPNTAEQQHQENHQPFGLHTPSSMDPINHQQDSWNNNAFSEQQQPDTITAGQNNATSGSNDMVMDMCNETYSNTRLSTDTETMQSTMDSDFVPDYQQYGIAFCDSNCVGGDRSPTSGRVRCYCKPSWEGLTEPRPYVSDYY